MKETLTQQELDERIAILRRFRALLEQQRAKFQEYLKVLELQESKIEEDDADAIMAHSELENQIVAGIGSLQKVIAPMQELYARSKASTYDPSEALPIVQIQGDLARLQSQVLAQNEKNRRLLKMHITEVRQQIASLNLPYRARKSVYAERGTSGGLIHLEA